MPMIIDYTQLSHIPL